MTIYSDPEGVVHAEQQRLGPNDVVVAVTAVRAVAQKLALNKLIALTSSSLAAHKPKLFFDSPEIEHKPLRWPRSHVQYIVWYALPHCLSVSLNLALHSRRAICEKGVSLPLVSGHAQRWL